MQQIGLADACACACVPVGLSGCAKWPATVERNSPGLVEKRRKLKWVSCGQHISFPPTPPALRSAALRCGLANPVRLGRLFGCFPLFSASCHSILRLRCDSFFFLLPHFGPFDGGRGGSAAGREISRGHALPSVDGQLRLSNFARRTHAPCQTRGGPFPLCRRKFSSSLTTFR